MALKSGIVSCVKRALGFRQPTLSLPSVSVLNLPQRCHLSSNVAPFILNNSLLHSSNQTGVYKEKLTLCQHPLQTVPVCFQQVREYHSVLRPRLHCKGCYFVWRHGRKYVECSDTPSHKQMKKMLTRKLWKEDYTKGHVRKAMMWNRDLMRITDRRCDRNVVSHNWLASRIGKDV